MVMEKQHLMKLRQWWPVRWASKEEEEEVAAVDEGQIASASQSKSTRILFSSRAQCN